MMQLCTRPRIDSIRPANSGSLSELNEGVARFAARPHEFRLEGELSVGPHLLPKEGDPYKALCAAKDEFYTYATLKVKEQFHALTGSDEYFKKYVSFNLTWLLNELITNELAHGLLNYDSPSKQLLGKSPEQLAESNPEIDSQSRYQEIVQDLEARVRAIPPRATIGLAIQTSSDEEGRSVLVVSVGVTDSSRVFDLNATLSKILARDAQVEALFAKADTESITAAQELLNDPWGRGLHVALGKLSKAGESLRQEPALTGPIIATIVLPTN